MSPVLVVLVALASSITGITNAFTFDDISIIRDSPRLHDLGQLKEILTSPYWPPPWIPDLYRPVTSFLLAIEYSLGDGGPIIFRIVSYALYAAACVGVFRLASRIVPVQVALFVAALFAAHPLHVEAVAGAVSQNELIVALLATVMVSHYLQRRRGQSPSAPEPSWGLLSAMYIVAGLAKEQGLMIPAFLLAAEFLFVNRTTFAVRFKELWQGYLVLALFAIGIVGIRTAVLGGHFQPPVATEALASLSFGGRTLTMLHVAVEWSRLLVWPAHLRVDYRPQEFVASTSFGAYEALGLVLICAALWLAWWARKRAPAVTFGIVWCAIALLPVSNLLFPTFILIAERTLFLPSVGFVFAIGGVVELLLAKAGVARLRQRWLLPAVAGVLIVAGVAKSAIRQRVWHDTRSLAMSAAADSPRSSSAWKGLADELFSTHEDNDAIAAYQRAITLAPEPYLVRNQFAKQLRMVSRDSEAIVQLRASIAEHADQVFPLASLPPALIAIGRYREARDLADSVIKAANAPPIMLWFRNVADSAIAHNAPPGSVRIGIGIQ